MHLYGAPCADCCAGRLNVGGRFAPRRADSFLADQSAAPQQCQRLGPSLLPARPVTDGGVRKLRLAPFTVRALGRALIVCSTTITFKIKDSPHCNSVFCLIDDYMLLLDDYQSSAALQGTDVNIMIGEIGMGQIKITGLHEMQCSCFRCAGCQSMQAVSSQEQKGG